jgi:FkbM family methyltransferase
MDSYDVFDTIIGRLCYKGTEIFAIIEKLTGIKDFKNKRIQCESSSLEETYKKLGLGEDIKLLELQIEEELSFPIWKYINRVRDSDIFISDMYLSESQIRRLICKHREFNNPLFVSPGGKSSCQIWKSPIARSIRLHTGDNYNSDYLNAMQYGVKAEWVSNVELSPIEKFILNIHPEFAYIIRAVRLSMQHLDSDSYRIFINAVLPISIISCMAINAMRNNRDIVFLSRDGYWLYNIYNIIYPNNYTEYCYFSRLYMSNSENLKTINNRFKDKIVIDLFGSGNTGKLLTSCSSYINIFKYGDNNSNINGFVTLSNHPIFKYIEDIFSAPHGSVNKDGTFLDPEYDILWLTDYMKCLSEFNKYVNIYSKYTKYDNCNSNIKDVLTYMINVIDINIVSSVEKYVVHLNNHSETYKHYPLRYFSQINQDKYYIENISKFKCNGTFIEIGGYDGITGSNTYFLEKYLNWSGLIVECNPEIVELCKKNRRNPVCDKAIYKDSGSTVEFIIPGGEEIEGGKGQLSGIKDFIKKESLQCFKSSYNNSRIVNISTININDLLDQYNMLNIDYMSIDIEGYEFELLKCIDYSKFKINYITVEHGSVQEYRNIIFSLMTANGYNLVRHNQHDSEYRL